MLYRFCKVDANNYSAYALTLRDLKAKIDGWFPSSNKITYVFPDRDNETECLVYIDGTLYGGIDLGHKE